LSQTLLAKQDKEKVTFFAKAKQSIHYIIHTSLTKNNKQSKLQYCDSCLHKGVKVLFLGMSSLNRTAMITIYDLQMGMETEDEGSLGVMRGLWCAFDNTMGARIH